jgi:hypothetical protein
MNPAIADLSGNTFFDVRVRQAILAAQHCVKQVGLLLIDTTNIADFQVYDSAMVQEFVEMIWGRARTVLRDSDTIAGWTMGGWQFSCLLLPALKTSFSSQKNS